MIWLFSLSSWTHSLAYVNWEVISSDEELGYLGISSSNLDTSKIVEDKRYWDDYEVSTRMSSLTKSDPSSKFFKLKYSWETEIPTGALGHSSLLTSTKLGN